MGLCLLWVQSVSAYVLPVVDLDVIRQMLTTYRTQLDQLLQEKQQLETQLSSLERLKTQVTQGATNLQSLKVTNLQDVVTLMGRLEGQLAEAQAISYKVAQARQQAEDLYAKAQGRPTAAQQREIQRRWAAAQRDSAALAVKAQAIQEQQAGLRQQWANVEARAAAAQGNLEIQQAQAQGQALLGTQLEVITQQLATQGRMRSQQEMQAATEAEAALLRLEEAAGELDTSARDAGEFLSLSQ